MTARQAAVVNALREYRVRHGYSPTLRELARDLGVSVVTVFQHVQILVADGVLRQRAGHHRSLEVVGDTAVLDRAIVRAVAEQLANPTRENVLAARNKLLAVLA